MTCKVSIIIDATKELTVMEQKMETSDGSPKKILQVYPYVQISTI